jgi:hypothetical protein
MRGLSLGWLDLAFATNDGECAVTVAQGPGMLHMS